MERLRPAPIEAKHSESQGSPQKLELKKRVEKEAPTDPEEIFACLVNACHLELGILAYLSLDENLPGKTPQELVDQISPNVSSKNKFNRTGQVRAYFEHIFIDVALVAQETYLDIATGKQISFYSLTEFGKKYQGIGYFLLSQLTELNRKRNTDLALPQIFTKSASAHFKKDEKHKKLPATRRGPYIRMRVIEELEKLPTGETTKIKTIVDTLGVSETAIGQHLDNLKHAKIAVFESEKLEKRGGVVYTPVISLPDDIEDYLNSKDKDKDIVSDILNLVLNQIKTTLENDPSAGFDLYTLSEALYPVHCKMRVAQVKKVIKIESFEKSVSSILSLLRKGGYFSSRYVPGEQYSHAGLTLLGRGVASILAQAKRACFDPIELQKISEEFRYSFADFAATNTETILRRHKEHGKSQGSKNERIVFLFDLLIKNPQGIRSREMYKRIGIQVGSYLSELIKYGILQQEWSSSKGRQKSTRGIASIYTLSPRAREILGRNPDISYEDLKMLLSPTLPPNPDNR